MRTEIFKVSVLLWQILFDESEKEMKKPEAVEGFGFSFYRRDQSVVHLISQRERSWRKTVCKTPPLR